jgi:hypothetical protein
VWAGCGARETVGFADEPAMTGHAAVSHNSQSA